MPDKVWTQDGGLTRRMQEVAPGEFADEVYARDAWSAAISLGKAYIIGSGRISLSVAGNVRGLLANPVANANANPDGSHRRIIVLGLSSFGTGTGWATIYNDPTTGLPATAVRPRWRMNPYAGDVGTAEMQVDTNATTALSGGTDTGVVIGLPPNAREEMRPIGRVIAPGASLGINIPFAGAADASFNLYVVEE